MIDPELEKFKREISLVDFAQQEFNFQLIKKESSKAYFVLKNGDEKIVVTRKNEHDVYFNVKDSDRGSIVDFVKNRIGDNNEKLVRVRQTLRPWAPDSKKPSLNKPTAAPIRPISIPRDLGQVVADWKSMAPYSGKYLTETRKLDQRIIDAFDVKQDKYGNACFKHLRPGEGVTGYEMKNKPLPGSDETFTCFSGGGEKALMVGRLDALPISRIVVTESSIDALSYAQMHHQPGSLYVSVGGSTSDAQQAQLKHMFEGYPKAALLLATDNDLTDKHGRALAFEDRPGEKLAKQISGLAPEGMSVTRHTPAEKDWMSAPIE